jgi:hypothetical protein
MTFRNDAMEEAGEKLSGCVYFIQDTILKFEYSGSVAVASEHLSMLLAYADAAQWTLDTLRKLALEAERKLHEGQS